MYDIKEVELTNTNKTIKKKRPVIIFHDKQMAIVGEFLMTDAGLLGGRVLQLISSVLKGETQDEHFIGNRCHLLIKKDVTIIEDLFEETDGMLVYSAYTIETTLLYELTKMWLGLIKSYEI